MYDALLIQLEKQRVPISTKAYTFDFGPQELVNMVGLQKSDGNMALRTMFENSYLKITDNKIHVTRIDEIEKQAKYYRKMEKISQARKGVATGL
jgi:hypothetical protein